MLRTRVTSLAHLRRGVFHLCAYLVTLWRTDAVAHAPLLRRVPGENTLPRSDSLRLRACAGCRIDLTHATLCRLRTRTSACQSPTRRPLTARTRGWWRLEDA